MTLSDIRIWTGPARSGKSTRIVHEILDTVAKSPLGPPIYWVVPDDVAFFAEQMLLREQPSVLRAEVITMSRLAERIRSKAGNTHVVSINQAGKRLLLAAAYSELRDDLTILGNAQATGGFYDLVLDTFDEMTSYNVNLGALQGALETASAMIESNDHPSPKSGHSLIGKLRDLCALYVRYRTMLDERMFFDPAMNLADASARMSGVVELSEAQVYVDGFDWLRPNQLEFVSTLMRVVDRTTVVFSVNDAESLLYDWQNHRAGSNLQDLFLSNDVTEMLRFISLSTSKETPSSAVTLLRLASKLDGMAIPYHVECSADELQTESNEPLVRLWEVHSTDDECREVSRDILRLVDVHDVKYRDIAVVVPELHHVGRMVTAQLRRSKIPSAVDDFPSVAGHPLGRFTIAVLRFVASDMSVDATARLLRTTFALLDASDAMWLDIYVRQYQIEGSDVWLNDADWTYAQSASDQRHQDAAIRSDERANRLRKRLMATFGVFFSKVDKGIVTPYELATALWVLFEQVSAKDILARQIVLEDVGQNPLQASQDEQVWQQFVNLLNDLATVHKDAPFVREELFELVVDLLLSEHQTTIPNGVDEVFVSSYRNAHMWSKPYVFVIGMSRENLPRWSRSPALLQDDERDAFRTLFGTTLAPTSFEQLELDKEIAYQLQNRANDVLTLSYATSSQGFETLPSRSYRQIQRDKGVDPIRIGNLEQFLTSDSNEQPLLVLSENEALSHLLSRLSDARQSGIDTVLREQTIVELGKWFSIDATRRTVFHRAVRGLRHGLSAGRISRELVQRLYGIPLRTSVHRLETYAACPYRYFLRYGLRLEPLMFDALEAVDIGNLLHDTIFDLVMLDRNGEVDFRTLELEDMLSIAMDIYQKQLNHRKHAVFRSRKWREARAEDLSIYVRSVAEMLWSHANRGSFRPFALEWSFGLDDTSSLPLIVRLPSGEEVHLRGRIDRLDTYTEAGVTWFRIFDYKSGTSNKMDLTRLFYGLQMQLFVYMAAVRVHLSKGDAAVDVKPAGAFYLPMVTQPGINDIPVDAASAKAQLYKLFRAEGYMTASKDAIAAMDDSLGRMQTSELFGSLYRKDGTFLKTAKVWSEQEWDLLMAFTLQQVERLSSRIVRGEIPVHPYFIAHDARACTHCEFSAVCHFEPADHARSYNMVKQKSLDDYTPDDVDGGLQA